MSNILAEMALYIEQICPDYLVGVMLTDNHRDFLLARPSPSLPADYLASTNYLEIGEGIGICGSAAWHGTTVIAEDLRPHPYCAEFRDVTAKASLLACWSEPILNAAERVLGTFCVYLQRPGRPTVNDLKPVRQIIRLAAIAIERAHAEERLRESETQLREVFKNSSDTALQLELTKKGRLRNIQINLPSNAALGGGGPR